MRSGEMPLTSAPVSVSDAARVAMPKRVNRYTAASDECDGDDGDREARAGRWAPSGRRGDRSVRWGRSAPRRICDVPTLWAISAVRQRGHPERGHGFGHAASPAAAAGTRRRYSATPTSPSIRDGDDRWRARSHRAADVDGARQRRQRDEQFAPPQERERERGVQRERPGGEVDDAGAAVADDERHAQARRTPRRCRHRAGRS